MKNRLIILLALTLFSLAACTERAPEGSAPTKAQDVPATQDTMPQDNMGKGSSPGGGGQ